MCVGALTRDSVQQVIFFSEVILKKIISILWVFSGN